jgi:hypothetical protein
LTVTCNPAIVKTQFIDGAFGVIQPATPAPSYSPSTSAAVPAVANPL